MCRYCILDIVKSRRGYSSDFFIVVWQYPNDQEANRPSTANIPRQDLPPRRVAHTNSPTNSMVRPPTQSWPNHLDQQAKYGKEYPTGDTKCWRPRENFHLGISCTGHTTLEWSSEYSPKSNRSICQRTTRTSHEKIMHLRRKKHEDLQYRPLPPTPPPHESDVPKSPHHQTSPPPPSPPSTPPNRSSSPLSRNPGS